RPRGKPQPRPRKASGASSGASASRPSAGRYSSSTEPARFRDGASSVSSGRLRIFEKLQPVLELRDAELELVEIVAPHKLELVDERAQCSDGLLRELRLTAARAAWQLGKELLHH